MSKAPNATKQAKATQVSPSSVNTPASNTPPISPALEPVEPRAHGVIAPTTTSVPAKSRSDGHNEPEKEIRRASKLAFETVDEVWDSTSSKYKIVSVIPVPEWDELDENMFVARRRIDKDTRESTCFVDIKSEGLRDVLRAVLESVKEISLKEDMLTIEQKLLYHYVPELDACARAEDDSLRKQLLLLVNYIKRSYALVRNRIRSLVAKSQEITFDLLWALFKPNDIVYGKCFGTEKPRCIIFDSGEVRKLEDGTEYFHIGGRYLDFNGKEFGEATTVLGIVKFDGAKRIDGLEAFPFQHHPRADVVRRELVDCGRKFQALLGSHHREYEGVAFFVERREIRSSSIHGRIVVDASLFYEVNPDYTKPRFDRRKGSETVTLWHSAETDRIGKQLPEPAKLDDEDFLVCSPTVLGFSLSTKQWLEFAVSDISDVDWNPESFKRLTIPETQKELLRAVAASHVKRTMCSFDDFVRGKGRGLVILLHGSPGVGKTLTAEGLSEHLEKPLYAISSGELSAAPKEAETQLSRIFRQAEKWNAVLLLDEADVFLRRRSLDHVRDAHITMFLRTLEYYRGILFLTTNRVKDFDDAMQSRIDLPLKYLDLSKDTRKTIWGEFLKRSTISIVNATEIEKLADRTLNGRQIKNAVKLAQEWASEKKSPLKYSLLETVLGAYEDFERHMVGHGSIESLNSYT